MVDMVQSKASPRYSASTRIILITPPPINEHQRKEDLESRDPPLELDRVFDITKQYAEAVKEVGAEKQVAVLDVWTSLWEAAGKDQASLSKYLSDGLHLTAEGYKVSFLCFFAGRLLKTCAGCVQWLDRYHKREISGDTSRKAPICLCSVSSYSVHSGCNVDTCIEGGPK